MRKEISAQCMRLSQSSDDNNDTRFKKGKRVDTLDTLLGSLVTTSGKNVRQVNVILFSSYLCSIVGERMDSSAVLAQ